MSIEQPCELHCHTALELGNHGIKGYLSLESDVNGAAVFVPVMSALCGTWKPSYNGRIVKLTSPWL